MESVLLLIILVVLIMLGAPVGFTMILIPVVYILITGRRADDPDSKPDVQRN